MKQGWRYRILILLVIVFAFAASVSYAMPTDPVTILFGEETLPCRITIYSPEVKTLSQFDQDRLEELNRLLKHLSYIINIDGECAEETLMIDQTDAYTAIRRDGETDTQTVYSLQPQTVYVQSSETQPAGPESMQSYLEVELPTINHMLNEFYVLFSEMPEIFSEYVKEAGTGIRLSGFGKAVKRITINFKPDFVREQYSQKLIQGTGSEYCKNILSDLIFEGNQKIDLLYDSDNQLIRISYNGKVGKSSESMRNVSLVWKCLHNEQGRKDSLVFKTPAVSGYDKNNIIIEREIDYSESDRQLFSFDIQTDQRAGEEKKYTRFSADIRSENQHMTGEMEFSKGKRNDAEKTKASFSVQEENIEECKGSLEIAEYSGKIEKSRFAVCLKLEPGHSVVWPDTGSYILIDLDRSEQSEQETELQEEIIKSIIRTMMQLPGEDLVYFSNGISEEVWLALIPIND